MGLLSPKILVLTPLNVACRWAGDWLQATRTAEALACIGCEVSHRVYESQPPQPDAAAPVGLELIRPHEVPAETDVLHFLPGRLTASEAAAWIEPCVRPPVLVGSSVFWDSRAHRRVVMANTTGNRLRQWLSYAGVYAARRRYSYLLPFDVVLPNSQAEVANCRRHQRLRDDAIVAAVPNGLDPLPLATEAAGAHYPGLGQHDYVIYPGVFSPRKNQLGFIRALRGQGYPVAFMGGPLGDHASQAYYERCREEADPAWVFTGPVPHRSPLFYALMAGARVACLASSCETPGIAALEAAALGARPAMTREGGAAEYLGFEAEYFDPTSPQDIRSGVVRAWERGRLEEPARQQVSCFTWERAARLTLFYYGVALEAKRRALRGA